HAARDARFAFRRVAQRPAFSIAVIGILALGIGSSVAMFSAVDAAMLRPLPFRDPQRLVVLHDVEVPFDPGTGVRQGPGPESISVGDVRAVPSLFAHVAVYAAGAMNLSDADHPSRLRVGVVSGDFFTTLGVPAAQGRAFGELDAVSNGRKVVVLAHGFWQRQFGGASVLGKSIMLNNVAYEVIGVMPRGFAFPAQSDVWIPMSIPNTFDTFSAFRGFLATVVIARVAPTATLPSASAWLMTEWERRAAIESTSAVDPNYRVIGHAVRELHAKGALEPLQSELVGKRRTALLVLLGATALLLLVTCANVTNLLLSQAAARRHEMAMRAVLGATRGRIIRQLLAESIVLAVAGTAAGIALAPVMLGTMRALLPAELSGVAPATIDLRVLAFAAGLALATGTAFGLWPAVGTARSAPAETIKTGGRQATALGAGRARRALVGAELALTVILLVGSLLMLRSFARLMSLDRGMRTNEVGTLELAFSSARGQTANLGKLQAMLGRMAAIPGVTSAGAINDIPLGPLGGIAVQIKVDGAAPDTPESEETITGNKYPRYLMASSGYFATMGIALKRGRTFTATDDSLAPPVAVISESMARMYWPGVDPIGRTFTSAAPKPITVIGIVADVRERSLEAADRIQMYFPITERTPSNVALVARGAVESDALLARMREAVRAVDPAQAIFNVRSMDDVVSTSVAPRRTNTLLISAFAAIALLLSAVGIYAVVSFSVTQRWREFGIRSALGATGGGIVALVAGEMATVAGVGLVAGVAGAWALSRVLISLIYGVSAHDPATFLVAPLVMLIPAVLATLLPARRATKVNPAEVMRAD
ncbi:MAG: ABC transporter permease, partial [Gemmatimonadales bacterium]